MKSTLLFLFLFSGTFITAQNDPDVIGKRIDTIRSAILNEDRYIWLHVPDRAAVASPYPVIYILDGQILFDQVIGILNRLSKETGKNVFNKMVVVGVGNVWQRYRDYSPTHITSSPWVDSHSVSISGGGEKFISFLKNELFPHIQSRYADSSIRILIGHSMGGLQVMNILLRYPDMFNYYVAIDPSMWWDDQKLLNDSKKILAGKAFEKRTLFLAIANTKDLDMDISQIKKDTSVKTVLIRPSLTLVEYIDDNSQNKLRFSWKFYKDQQHMTVPAPAMYDAVKLFLESLNTGHKKH